ncbi:MAG: hypothetical protein HWQ38_29495 [Nostoc sp. NMS7]|uniref:B3/B4 domain-containing protein n=1 Tax=Nostoc sp. NMS7 TaxID=2815391 RepID=UPI0025F12B60|nr:phenylalanine--tRNA ligase beta subunit-related protein [Nostoc sp. NMS7]MBN3950379.1 hypothetical protein [Nostoc sp. NMS7]
MKLSYVMSPYFKSLGITSTVVAEIYGINIERENPEVEMIKNQAAKEVMKMSDEFISDNTILQSYRDLLKSIGRSPKKFPPSAESLIQSVKHFQRFPQINVAVDSYNVIASRNFLALGVHDLDKLGSKITFRLSDGEEPFTAVGSQKVKYTQPGDFVYADERQILAWLDSKDSELVKLSLDTKNIVIIIQGTHQTTQEYNLAALENACKLITRFCGGTFEIQAVE